MQDTNNVHGVCLQSVINPNRFKSNDGPWEDRGLKQAEAADLLGVKQPDVSKTLRGDFKQFSVERLLRFLVALNQDVKIVVKPRPK